MKIISKADVVLALGSRLNLLGMSPQYEMDFWPQDAKIIQVQSKEKQENKHFFLQTR